MKLPSEGYMLRIIIGEAARYEHKHLYEWIIIKAREQGIAGATAMRGMMGLRRRLTDQNQLHSLPVRGSAGGAGAD